MLLQPRETEEYMTVLVWLVSLSVAAVLTLSLVLSVAFLCVRRKNRDRVADFGDNANSSFYKVTIVNSKSKHDDVKRTKNSNGDVRLLDDSDYYIASSESSQSDRS